MRPASRSARTDCSEAPVNSRRSGRAARPMAQSVRRSSDCCGARRRFCSAASAASSAGTARAAMVTYLSLTRRLPFLNHSPAGSMALTASYTVQKKRSCIQSASFICAWVSIGASSSTSEMGFSFS